MKNKIIIFVSLLCMAFFAPEKKPVKIFMAGDSTMAIKETKYFPETGWGMPFVYFWDSSVTVVNKAKNGRSTKSFFKEGLWQSIMNEAKEGDYVFIQFGHNDESVDKGERYSTPDTFKMNLTKFIQETRAKGATPILFTPVSRRNFDKDGIAVETHKAYSQLVREVAQEQQVLFIDLDEKSRSLYQQFGETNSKLLFLQLQPGEHPNYPAGKIDNTHFSELGARLIAQIVLKEINTLGLELKDRMIMPAVKK